ncbi:MAG: AsmA family protein [Alphaproteobacteria bacterium]|nr:AsmA family protein [Alphaproteobacteria bacterium]
MRRIVIGLVAVVALLLVAVLVAPGLIDWNQHKERIAREAEAATGRKLAIAGDISLAVLPSPHLRVRDVRLANAPGAAVPDMVVLKALEVDVALWPLLSGSIAVTRVRLVEPVIELQTLADGSGNWMMKPPEATPPAPPSAPAPAGTPARSEAAMPVRLDDIAIENGTLVWRDAKGVAERVERINVAAAAESLQGPFRVKGSAVLRGTPATIDADIGRLDPQGTTPIRVVLGLDKAKATATVVATLGPEAAARRIEGTVKIAAESLATALAAVTGSAGGAPAGPLALDSAFVLEGGKTRADPLTLRVDDLTVTGRIEAAPDRAGRTAIAAVLRTPRIDADRLAALAARPPEARPGAAGPATPDAAAKAEFALPTGIAVRVDLTADAVAAQGQTLRNLRIVAQLAQGRLAFDRASVQLPGPSELSVTGTLVAAQGQPQFDGKVQLNAQSLRTLLAAYKAAPEGMPADKLGRMTFQGRLKATPAQVEIQDVALALDGMKATGGGTVRLGGRPAVGARVVVDRLDVDGYLRKAPARPGAAAAGAAASPAKPAGGGAFDPGVDMDIDARAGQLVAGGQTARDVAFSGTLQGGQLALRQLAVADYAGATMKIQGTVKDLGPAPSVDLTVQASGRDLGRVLSQGGAAAPAQAQQPFSIDGKVAGTAGKLAVDLAARLGDGQAKVTGTVEPLRGLPGVALAIDAGHPSTGRLLSQLSPGYRPQGGDIGAFRFVARTRSDGATLFLDGFSLAAGPARLEGPVRIETGGPRPRLVADLVGTELAIDPFLPVEERAEAPSPLLPRVMLAQARPGRPQPAPAARPGERWSRTPLDLSALLGNDADVKLRAAGFKQGRWLVTRPDVALTLADGTLSLARFTGQVYGGDVTITGQLVAKGVPTGRFELKAQNVDVGKAVDTGRVVRLVGGRAKADMALQTSGRSMHDLVSALAGKGAIDVRDGTLRGLNFSAAARSIQATDLTKLPNILQLVQEVGKDGDTQFSSLTGTFRVERGEVRSDDLKMVATGFGATGTTVTRLVPWTTETRIEAQIPAKPEPVPVSMRLEGSIDEPRKIFDTNALQAYLAQRYGGGRLQQIVPGLKLPGEQQPPADGQKPRRSNPLEQLAPLLRR